MPFAPLWKDGDRGRRGNLEIIMKSAKIRTAVRFTSFPFRVYWSVFHYPYQETL